MFCREIKCSKLFILLLVSVVVLNLRVEFLYLHIFAILGGDSTNRTNVKASHIDNKKFL